MPPAPSTSAALGTAPSRWVRWGGDRSFAPQHPPDLPLAPGSDGCVTQTSLPCPRGVRRGAGSSAGGRNPSMGWGQHLGAPGCAEIPVAKGRIEQGGRTQLPPTRPGQGGCSIPAPSGTGEALPRRGALLPRLLGPPGLNPAWDRPAAAAGSCCERVSV